MKERILKGWTFWRFLYLGMGSVIIVDAILSRQWPALLLGGYFASMAVFNFGCAAGACYVPQGRRTERTKEAFRPDEVEIEEVKVKAE